MLGKKTYQEKLFVSLQLSDRVLDICVKKVMVSGVTRAVDSAYIKANASIDSLIGKTPVDTVKNHIEKVIRENDRVEERVKHTKETPPWKNKEIEQRHKRQAGRYKDQAVNKTKGRCLGNHTHYSPTDPDAKGNYFMRYSTSVTDCRDHQFAKRCKIRLRNKHTLYRAMW